jgi:3-oxoacyl-[acyl-carrier protein] reductase
MEPPHRVALVMAGSQGLGLATAQALVRSGHAVSICSRDRAHVDAAVEDLRAVGPALGVVADIAQPGAVEDVVAQVTSALGPVDVLVGNGGGPPPGGFRDVGQAEWEAAYRSTLRSVVDAVTAVLPHMRTQRWGRIAIIGSSSIRRPIPRLTLSNVLRPALNGLVKDLAVDLAPDGITVNMVAPGRFDTRRVRALDEAAAHRRGVSLDEVRAASEAAIPMGRYGRPEELAALVAFLASDAAGYLTGQSIAVDGAMTASHP